MAGRAGTGGQLATEKLEVLWGSRGNPREWALRRGELADVQKIIADVRKSLDSLKKALQEVKDDIDDINAQILEIENRLSSAEQAINDLDAALAALETRIDSAESALTQIEASIATITGQIGSIGGDVTQLQTDVTHLQADVTQLQSDVSGLDGDVTALQSDVNDLNIDVTALQGEVASVFAMQSNPGANPFDPGFEAIPFYTNGELTGGITVASSTTFTVPKAGLYQFELEVRTNGGATDHPPVGTGIGLSIDSPTLPTSLRAGYSTAETVRALTITRLVCVERLAAGAKRVAYFYNQGAAAYQVASAVIKITRISA